MSARRGPRGRGGGPAVRRMILGAALAVALTPTAAGAYSSDDLKRLRADNACERCDLSGALLRGEELVGAKLSGADLFAAAMEKANLSKADLSAANLMAADLERAKLNGADLSEARMDGADLTQADLTGANLRGADIDQAILGRARFCDTIMPDGAESDRGCP